MLVYGNPIKAARFRRGGATRWPRRPAAAAEGEPVIIDVLARLYDPDSGAHFILVTGVSADPKRGNAIMIHYNDPLSGKAWISRWDGGEGIWHAWKNNGDPGGSGWWLVIPPP